MEHLGPDPQAPRHERGDVDEKPLRPRLVYRVEHPRHVHAVEVGALGALAANQRADRAVLEKLLRPLHRLAGDSQELDAHGAEQLRIIDAGVRSFLADARPEEVEDPEHIEGRRRHACGPEPQGSYFPECLQRRIAVQHDVTSQMAVLTTNKAIRLLKPETFADFDRPHILLTKIVISLISVSQKRQITSCYSTKNIYHTIDHLNK